MKLFLFLVTMQGMLVPSWTINGVIWSRTENNFVPIFSIPSFSTIHQEILSKSREGETHNFQGKNLTFRYYQEQNIVHFYDTGISGMCGEIWNVLSEFLNFTLVPIEAAEASVGFLAENGTFVGILGTVSHSHDNVIPKLEMYTVRLDAIEFTMPLWKNSYRLYIQRSGVHDSSWMVKVFSWEVWCAILLVHLLLTVCGFLTQKLAEENNSDVHQMDVFADHYFYNFAMICNQSFIPSTIQGRPRLMDLCLGIFSSVMYIAFSTILFTYITRKIFVPPFKDLESLLDNTKYTIVTVEGSIAHIVFLKKTAPIYEEIMRRNRVLFVPSKEELYTRGCSKKEKYAVFDGEDMKNHDNMRTCHLNAVGISYYNMWLASGVSRGFKYKKSIDIGIIKLHEFGLMEALKQRWMKSHEELEDYSNEPEAIGMDQISLILVTLCTGTLIAFLVFLMENAVHRCQRLLLQLKK